MNSLPSASISLRPESHLPVSPESVPGSLLYSSTSARVRVRHAGYENTFEQNLLLQLNAWDTDAPPGGIHFGTVLIACAVIACNASDCWLSESRDGPPLQLALDHILPTGDYYLHVSSASTPTDDGRYCFPVCPSFEHWEFPHVWFESGLSPAELIAPWRRLDNTTDTRPILDEERFSPAAASLLRHRVSVRDQRCIVTKYADQGECAHLCPKGETEWFQTNGMTKYNINSELSGPDTTFDTTNALLMRRDIHTSFDERKFVLVPKAGSWVLHVLQSTAELGPLYHNRPVKLRGVAPQFLLTRLAWAILKQVRRFLEAGGTPKAVRFMARDTSGSMRFEEKVLQASELDSIITSRTRSRTGSPRKRPNSEASLSRVPEDEDGYGSDDDAEIDDEIAYPSPRETSRGRSLKRRRLNSSVYARQPQGDLSPPPISTAANKDSKNQAPSNPPTAS